MPPKSRAGELFRERMSLYLTTHGGKKFHDPAAAVRHRHPALAAWVRGTLLREAAGWTTRPHAVGPVHISADIDRKAHWEAIADGF